MDRYYGFIIPITFHSFLLPFMKLKSFKLCLKAFKETDAFKDLWSLFHNEGPIYDKARKPYLFYNDAILTFDRSNM